MKDSYRNLLIFILTGGTIFSWTTVYQDFVRFFNLYGDLFRIYDCEIPNPVTTPCFYGAIAFAKSIVSKSKFDLVIF